MRERERERERERKTSCNCNNQQKESGKKTRENLGKSGEEVHIIIMHINQSINVAIIIYPIQDTQFFFSLSFSHYFYFIY
jgi:hypothetical protein